MLGVSVTADATVELGMSRFGDHGLQAYIEAGTTAVPWTMLAAIDLVETGSMSAPTPSRLSQLKRSLVGNTVDQKLNNYAHSRVFTDIVKRRMNTFNVINRMMDSSHMFPLPKSSNYWYDDSWGAARNFGGVRFHEGIDIIAATGTPVYSACSGTVTKKGWLTLGGWRIGVEDENGIYYYYAHLSQYGNYEIGDKVCAGDILGYVGSTGSGPEGTDDVMTPHLHFGMYENDVAFNAYMFLKSWEK
jgi:murein DD-endopeptidase MepM/ murein hydrolase activator NlpD